MQHCMLNTTESLVDSSTHTTLYTRYDWIADCSPHTTLYAKWKSGWLLTSHNTVCRMTVHLITLYAGWLFTSRNTVCRMTVHLTQHCMPRENLVDCAPHITLYAKWKSSWLCTSHVQHCMPSESLIVYLTQHWIPEENIGAKCEGEWNGKAENREWISGSGRSMQGLYSDLLRA